MKCNYTFFDRFSNAIPISLLDYVQPICLPFDHDENENYVETTQLGKNDIPYDVKVAGWGATNERGRNPADALQKLTVPIFPGKSYP